MKLVEKRIEIRLLSDGFFFGVLNLNFGPAADPHAEEDLSCENTDQGDGVSVKLEACLNLGRGTILRSKNELIGSCAEHLFIGVDGARH